MVKLRQCIKVNVDAVYLTTLTKSFDDAVAEIGAMILVPEFALSLPASDSTLQQQVLASLKLDSFKKLVDWAPAALKPLIKVFEQKGVAPLDDVVEALLSGSRALFGAKLAPLGFAAPKPTRRNADDAGPLDLTVGATPIRINAGFCNNELRIDINVGVAALVRFRPLLGELFKVDAFKYSTDISASLRVEVSLGEILYILIFKIVFTSYLYFIYILKRNHLRKHKLFF